MTPISPRQGRHPHDDRETPFDDLVSLAEVATAGVRYHVRSGEPGIATALQRVSCAAWCAVDDPSCTHEVATEARTALASLNGYAGARYSRRFLRDVIAFLHDAPLEQDHQAPAQEHPHPDQLSLLAPTDHRETR